MINQSLYRYSRCWGSLMEPIYLLALQSIVRLITQLYILTQSSKLEMNQTKFLAINAASFILLLVILFSFSLSIQTFLLALIIMVLNIWIGVRCYLRISEQNGGKFSKGKRLQNIFKFQNKVKEAYDKSLARQAENYRAQDYYWSKNYLRQSDQIVELRKTSLAQQYKNSTSRREMTSHQEEGSSAKRVRTFFANKKEDTIIPSQVKKEIKAIAEAYFSKQPFKSQRRTSLFDQCQIMSCIKIISEFINTKIQAEIDGIIEDFQTVDRFLKRCFEVSLTLQRPISQQFITYAELLQLTHIIQTKRIVPTKFKTNMSALQINSKLAEVKKNINRLPAFSLNSNVLKLAMALKYLRKDFPDVNIIFADFTRDDKVRQGEKHIIRLQDDDRFFYHKYPQVKTRQASIVILLMLINIFQKYQKSGKHLIRQLSMELGLKCY